jgi:hypothetical protein
MIVFLLIYISVFFYSIYNILNNKIAHVVTFFIFALPIYITSMSVAVLFNIDYVIPYIQLSKEIIVLFALFILLLKNKIDFVITRYDKVILTYLIIILFYTLLPIGQSSLYQRIVAMKSIAFFPFVYFIGRLIPFENINLNKVFRFVCIVSILAAIVILIEVVNDKHLQSSTGYAEFILKYFNQYPSGNYGLSWTFETDNGLKRYSSFFSMPLENAAATLVTISVVFSLAINNLNKIKADKYLYLTLIATCILILYAISRASLVSFLLIFYFFSIVSKNNSLRKTLNYLFITLILFFLISINGNVKDFILSTIMFTNSSSLTHLIAWTESISTIFNNPFGIGMGTSGNVGNSGNISIGGENQFFIIAIQTGIISMLIYAYLYYYIIVIAKSAFENYNGKIKKLALFIILVKIGLFIPMLTSEIESYIYISYFTWFFSGYLINLISNNNILINVEQEGN